MHYLQSSVNNLSSPQTVSTLHFHPSTFLLLLKLHCLMFGVGNRFLVAREPNNAARIDPSTAKPTVESIARWALMIPDAMPARSGGTAVMASDVIGVRQSAPPRAAKTKPTTTATMLAGIDTIMIASPAISDDR